MHRVLADYEDLYQEGRAQRHRKRCPIRHGRGLLRWFSPVTLRPGPSVANGTLVLPRPGSYYPVVPSGLGPAGPQMHPRWVRYRLDGRPVPLGTLDALTLA